MYANAPRRWLLVWALIFGLLLTSTPTANAQDVKPEPYNDYYEIVSYTETPTRIDAVVRINTSQDTFLSSRNPNSNYGGDGSLRLGWEANEFDAVRMMIQFDLGGIPSNATVNSARLNIYQSQSIPSNDGSMGYRAQFVRSSWSEFGATWNNANFLGGDPLPLGQVNNQDGWKSGDVTNLIHAWLSGAETNHGLILTGDETPSNNRSRIFNSRETGLGAYIDVDYSVQCDTIAPQTNVGPLPNYSPGTFEVSWGGQDFAPSGCTPSGISYYDVYYRINGGSWVHWKNQTTATQNNFKDYASNGDRVELMSRGTDRAGNQEQENPPQAATTIDTLPPTTSMTPLPQFTTSPNFTVNWSGNDNLSGVRNYDLQWRANDGTWQTLISETTLTSFQITGAQPNVIYDFRVRATDNVGNVQNFPESPQASTTIREYSVAQVSPFVPAVVTSSTPNPGGVNVNWNVTEVPGTQVTSVEIFYQFNGGSWTAWQTFPGSQFSARFDYASLGLGDGVFGFEAIATNNLGQTQPRTQTAQAAVAIDLNDEIQPAQFLPTIFTARQ
jgi:hypothetical protein